MKKVFGITASLTFCVIAASASAKNADGTADNVIAIGTAQAASAAPVVISQVTEGQYSSGLAVALSGSGRTGSITGGVPGSSSITGGVPGRARSSSITGGVPGSSSITGGVPGRARSSSITGGVPGSSSITGGVPGSSSITGGVPGSSSITGGVPGSQITGARG
jgi:hypothetical protein